MKKKSLAVLAVSAIFSLALAGGTMAALPGFEAETAGIVACAEGEIYPTSVTEKDCVVKGSASKGCVVAANVQNAARLTFEIRQQMTADSYLNVKGYASSAINRIIAAYRLGDASSVRFADNMLDYGAATYDEATGIFEWHIKLSDVSADFTTQLFKDMYIEFRLADTSVLGDVQILGVAIDSTGTYGDFAAKDSIPVQEDKTVKFGAWSASNASVTMTTPAGSLAKATYTSVVDEATDQMTDSSVYISVATTDFDAVAANAYLSVRYAGTDVSDIGLYVGYTDTNGNKGVAFVMAPGGWTQKENTDYPTVGFSVLTGQIGAYFAGDELTMATVDSVIFKMKAKANATFEVFELELTADGVHGFEVPLGEMEISDIAAPEGSSVEKNAEGDQVVSYNAPFGWSTFNIAVKNYDASDNIFEMRFTPSASVQICIDINGTIDWSLGHKTYAEGRTNVEQIDVTDYKLPHNFTIKIYIDAENGDAAAPVAKTVTFHSITFKTPEPEPEGLYFKTPKAVEDITCLESAAGYTVSYTNQKDVKSWRRIVIGVGNYETDYDILSFDIDVYSGMRLGIRVVYTEEVEGEISEVYEYLRNHWSNDSVFTRDGRVSLVFFLEAYKLAGKNVTSIEMYFDPTVDDNLLPKEGPQEINLYNFQLLKSSEQDFETMVITADALTVDYGTEYAYAATAKDGDGADLEAELVYEYRPIKSADEEESEWSGTVPSDAGEYEVRVTYMGSLSYDYQVVVSKLTINKVKAVTAEDGVSFDAATRVVTVATGYEASTSEEFEDGFAVENGAIVNYGTKIYYRAVADDNHTVGDVMSKTLNRPAASDGTSSSDITDKTSEGGSGSETGDKKGCGSSLLTMSAAVLGGVALVVLKKKKS